MEVDIGNGVHVRTPALTAIIDESMGYHIRAVELFDDPATDREGGRAVNEFVWNAIR